MMTKLTIKRLLNYRTHLEKILKSLRRAASEEIRRGGPQRYAY